MIRIENLSSRLVKWLEDHTDVAEWHPDAIVEVREAFESIISLWAATEAKRIMARVLHHQ